jgi:flagellin
VAANATLNFQVGANSTDVIAVDGTTFDMDALVTAVGAIAIGTAAGATTALGVADTQLDVVNTARADAGAFQSRFEAVVTQLQVYSENTAAARGRIVDADFAQETANLSRAQVLQQAGTAMVAQANSLPQQVLALLR